MKLGEIILKNEREKQNKKNAALVRAKLRDLAYVYPEEVTRVLIATGVKIKKGLPGQILLGVTKKHLHKNSKLREAIARMLLEMDGYLSANGQTWGLVGGALSAVGSVLSGISRSQTQTPDQQALLLQQQQMQQQLEQERARRRRTTGIVIGVSILVIIGLVIAFKSSANKSVEMAQGTNPQLAAA